MSELTLHRELPSEFYKEPVKPYHDELISPEGLPYFGDLIKIRETLERNVKGFPDGNCSEASRLVHLITGLEEIGGVYQPMLESGERMHFSPHSWNYDKERKLYVDLAQDQFLLLPKIVVLRKDNSILKPTFENTRLQKGYILQKISLLAEKLN